MPSLRPAHPVKPFLGGFFSKKPHLSERVIGWWYRGFGDQEPVLLLPGFWEIRWTNLLVDQYNLEQLILFFFALSFVLLQWASRNSGFFLISDDSMVMPLLSHCPNPPSSFRPSLPILPLPQYFLAYWKNYQAMGLISFLERIATIHPAGLRSADTK